MLRCGNARPLLKNAVKFFQSNKNPRPNRVSAVPTHVGICA